MRFFLTRLACFSGIGLLPVLALFVTYVCFDPFRVLRDYSDYSNPKVIPNRDYISTTMFDKNYKKYKYNSFIFGSSRTLAFKPNSWQNYLQIKSMPYMFDASAESIYGIYTKLKYLDSKNIEIRNVLIIMCRDVTFNDVEKNDGHLFIKHPVTSGDHFFNFHSKFFKAYLNLNFLFNFYSFKVIGNYRPYMTGYLENRMITYDTITNECNIVDQEKEIKQNPNEYFANRNDLFYARSGETLDSLQRITSKHVFMLKEIKRILEKNNTSYKVVVSPLYDQIKLNPVDFSILKNIFGKNLYDVSGENCFTENIRNYYEPSHYRPNVGDSILQLIYK
jgi:hypothetical protein